MGGAASVLQDRLVALVGERDELIAQVAALSERAAAAAARLVGLQEPAEEGDAGDRVAVAAAPEGDAGGAAVAAAPESDADAGGAAVAAALEGDADGAAVAAAQPPERPEAFGSGEERGAAGAAAGSRSAATTVSPGVPLSPVGADDVAEARKHGAAVLEEVLTEDEDFDAELESAAARRHSAAVLDELLSEDEESSAADVASADVDAAAALASDSAGTASGGAAQTNPKHAAPRDRESEPVAAAQGGAERGAAVAGAAHTRAGASADERFAAMLEESRRRSLERAAEASAKRREQDAQEARRASGQPLLDADGGGETGSEMAMGSSSSPSSSPHLAWARGAPSPTTGRPSYGFAGLVPSSHPIVVRAKTQDEEFREAVLHTVDEIEAGGPGHEQFEELDPRAIKAAKWTNKWIRILIEKIEKNGAPWPAPHRHEGKVGITFGRLFDVTVHDMTALSGLLKTARKYGVVDYEVESDHLLQRVHDDVEITLLKHTFDGITIRRRLKSEVESNLANSPKSVARGLGNEFRHGEVCDSPICDHIVYQADYVAAGGKQYCRKCFRCATCGKQMLQWDYCVSRDMRERCTHCHRKFERSAF